MKQSLVLVSIAALSSPVLAALAALAAAACGGATETELFGPVDSTQLGTEPPSSSGSAGTSGGTSGESSSGTSGESSSGSTSSSSGSTSSSSSGSSGGTDSGVSTNLGIYCGEDSSGSDRHCSPSTHVCCMSRPWGNEESTFACEAKGIVNCVTSKTIACDDRHDCPASQVCCGLLDNSGYSGVSCQAQCKSPPGMQAVQFCDPSTPNECPSGTQCEESQRIPGYYVCKT